MCHSSTGELEDSAALTPQGQRKARGLEEPFKRLLNLNLVASVPVLNESEELIGPNKTGIAGKGV